MRRENNKIVQEGGKILKLWRRPGIKKVEKGKG